MPKLNSYLIKENYKQVEEVREIENKELITPEEQANLTIKNEAPSFEEFMKTYEGEEGVIDSYEFEVDSYGDIRIKGTYYGPGVWDDFLRPVTATALAISYAIPPVAAVTIPASIAIGASGATMAMSDDKDAKNVGRQMLAVVGEATATHLSGGSSENVDKAKLIANYVIR